MACVPSWPRSATEARGGAERERGWRGCRSTCTLHGHIPPNECTRHVRGILCSPPPPPPPLPPPPLSPLQPSPPTENRPPPPSPNLRHSSLVPANLLPRLNPCHPSSFSSVLLFLFRSSPFLLHASLSFSSHPCRSSRTSLSRVPPCLAFSLRRVNSGPPPNRIALKPVFARGTQCVALVAARADARRSPGSSVGGFAPFAGTLRSWGCARFSPPPACLRTYPAPAIGTHN